MNKLETTKIEALLNSLNQTEVSEGDYPQFMVNHSLALGQVLTELGRYIQNPRGNRGWVICVNTLVSLLHKLTALKLKPPRHLRKAHKRYLKALQYVNRILDITNGLTEGGGMDLKDKASKDLEKAEKVAHQLSEALLEIAKARR